MKAKLELILPKNPISFCGDSQTEKRKLKGVLRVIATQSIQLTNLEIIYKVKTHLHWRDDAHGTLFASRMTASRTLRKSTQTLLKKCTLTPGIIDLEFEISIPSYLCPSFKSQYCEVNHIIAAQLNTSFKFLLSKVKKQSYIEKIIQVRKTILPKEVLMKIVPVPHFTMTGERANVIQWTFHTPSSVQLDEMAEFKGCFKRANNKTITLNKIEIDVMQEELYYYDVSCTEIKRRLVTGNTTPSIYIEPPVDTIIPFSFPLNCTQKQFSPSLDSPFLKIRHFIRVILHLNNSASICIGLPIQVTTTKIKEEEYQQVDENRDDLFPPSYDYAIGQGEPLPRYKGGRRRRRSNSQYNVNYDDNSSTTPNPVEFVDHIDQLQQMTIDQLNDDRSSNSDSLNSAFSFSSVIKVGERSMKEFYAIN